MSRTGAGGSVPDKHLTTSTQQLRAFAGLDYAFLLWQLGVENVPKPAVSSEPVDVSLRTRSRAGYLQRDREPAKARHAGVRHRASNTGQLTVTVTAGGVEGPAGTVTRKR